VEGELIHGKVPTGISAAINLTLFFCLHSAALSALPNLHRLIVCCHSDCLVVDETSSADLSAFIDQVSFPFPILNLNFVSVFKIGFMTFQFACQSIVVS